MKEKQDKTNELIESEDDDTTSKKCGMLCKLKGIFKHFELAKKYKIQIN